jgi:hypothetical protein
MAVSGKRGRRASWGLVAAITAAVIAATGVFAQSAAANPPDPTRPDIELSVNASIDRPFTWKIDKTADKQNVTLQPGQTTTVTYTVTVTPTEGTTRWSAVGEIIVYNKELDAVTVNSVTNIISGVGPATVTCQGAPLPRQLNSGAQLRCRFFSDVPDNSNRISTATASVGSSVFTVSAPVDFGTAIDNRIDHCVSVNDSYAGLLAEQICVNKVDKTVTYTREIGPYAECGDYTVPNTAWAITQHTDTRVEDNFNVNVNVPCPRPCELGDYVWKDKDKDGKQDDGSMYGLNGVRLELLNASGNVVATTTTANHPTTGKPGYYRFAVVCGAEYKVRVKASNFANGGVLDDYVLTVRNAAADNIDSDGNPLTNASHAVVVPSGADLTVDFGFVSKKKECDKDDKYNKYGGHDRDDCDRDDDRCDRDKDDKYGSHDRDKYDRDDDCRDHDRDDDYDRDRCKDDHWNGGWGRDDRDYDGHDRDKGGWH